MFGLVTRSEFDEAMKQNKKACSFLRGCIDKLADQILAQPQPPQPPAPTLRKYVVKLKGGKTQTVIAAYDDVRDDDSLILYTRSLDLNANTEMLLANGYFRPDQWLSYVAEDFPEHE